MVWIFLVIVALWYWRQPGEPAATRPKGKGAPKLRAPTPAPDSQAAADPKGYADLWSALMDAGAACNLAAIDGGALSVLRYAGLPAASADVVALGNDVRRVHGCAARISPAPLVAGFGAVDGNNPLGGV